MWLQLTYLQIIATNYYMSDIRVVIRQTSTKSSRQSLCPSLLDLSMHEYADEYIYAFFW